MTSTSSGQGSKRKACASSRSTDSTSMSPCRPRHSNRTLSMTPRHFYQGKGLEPEEARKIVIELFKKRPDKPILVGPVCLEIGQNYGLNETEALLEEMVGEGILRRAHPKELVLKVHRAYVMPSGGVSSKGG